MENVSFRRKQVARVSPSPVGETNYEENQGVTTSIASIRNLSTSALLHRITQWGGGSPQEIGQVLTMAFGAEDYTDCVRDLKERDIDPQSYINSLDRVSSAHSISAQRTLLNDLMIDRRHPSVSFGCPET